MLDHPSKMISEAEAELYDRQIRLWGLDAQKRLRAAKVLVAGVRGLTVEVAKNLVLAGVSALTLLDHRPLSEADARVNFLAPRERVGRNRAESSRERLQALNPMVTVAADATDLADKEEAFFGAFDVVVVAAYPKDVKLRVNEFCRRQDVNFFCGDVYGFFGYSFMDLIEHEYVEETVVKPPPPPKSEVGEEPSAKRAKVEEAPESTTAMVKKTMRFVPLQESLSVDWSAAAASRLRRMNPAFVLLHVLFEFQSREGRSPSEEAREDDLRLLRRLAASVADKFGLPETARSTQAVAAALPLLFSESGSVAAVVGGKLAQEVIKTISNRDAPHLNFFLFNPLDGAGVVEAVGVQE